ncbi:LysR family transcriptional regulator [Pseudomonas syringae]|nr:LysR family transcriptional regulator [Pseudomonas syringae]
MATRPKVDLNLLESLHVLLSERNITYAAVKLGITQPALSAQLKRLRVAF